MQLIFSCCPETVWKNHATRTTTAVNQLSRVEHQMYRRGCGPQQHRMENTIRLQELDLLQDNRGAATERDVSGQVKLKEAFGACRTLSVSTIRELHPTATQQ